VSDSSTLKTRIPSPELLSKPEKEGFHKTFGQSYQLLHITGKKSLVFSGLRAKEKQEES
jgi:hypothetical protein